MFLFAASTILSVFVCTVISDNCPAKYRKFFPKHSFCLPSTPSKTCNGVTHNYIVGMSEIVEILDAHNTYRSKVAMGKEKRGRGLPTAANMMELTWDQELAEIAQKWAIQCNFNHDCEKCRATPTEKYVGQNLAETFYSCPKGTCEKKKPNWKGAVEMWYDEVFNFDKDMIPHYSFDPNFGHFTQVIWAETRTVGCGYISYPTNRWETQFYVCNYGPGGNRINQPVYKESAPCSQCPANTCCGDTCKTGKVYPGLCQATN